jgi:tetratricopeptide (TPR) repeat protein
MTKYRVRLGSGRVIGPFEKRELFELKAKGHIKGNEEAQIFPIGDWKELTAFDFYSELMDENRTLLARPEAEDSVPEDTFLIDLTKLRNVKNEKELESMNTGPSAPLEELTETVRLSEASPGEKRTEEDLFSRLDLSRVTRDSEAIIEDGDVLPQKNQLPKSEEHVSDEQTVINPIAQGELQRLKNLGRAKEEEEVTNNTDPQEEEIQAPVVLSPREVATQATPEEATQMLKLDNSSLAAEVSSSEMDLELELEKVEKDKKNDVPEEEEISDEEASKKKKKKMIILLAAAAILYAILFPDTKSGKPQFTHLEPKIIFPIPYDKADPKKSTVEFNRGLEFLTRATYPNLIKAGTSFKSSYENNMENHAALSYMVRSYAEQLKYSENLMTDSLTLFNLIQSKRPFLIQDPNGVIGLNIFYMTINKPDAAIDVVQKYLKLNPQKVTEDLFAIFLKSLMKRGRLDLARQFYIALERAPNKNNYTLQSLIDYHVLNQEFDRALEYVDAGIKKYPFLATFPLLKAELLIRQLKPNEAVPFVKKAQELNLDYNNINRAKFYELKGLIYSYRNKPRQASKYLSNSLKLHDSDELRMKLADLDSSNGSLLEADKLINESKAIKYLIQAKDFFEKKNYNLALSTAARATDAYPGHIPSEIFLSTVQLKLGQAQEGLKTLEGLVGKYPDDKAINLALVSGYIETYKFNEAKNRIQIISSSDYRDTWEYASVNAKLQSKLGDSLQAMSWLKSSISLNPLNDKDIFSLAQILIKKANFDAARILLNKCIELDPLNPEYRIAYARLIYETQDDLAAIGYLLSLKDDFPDHPRIMSEIAIFYYRSGKVKDFQDFKTKLENLHSSDRALYDFLIKAALLDDRFQDIPALVSKLLEIEPGDLESMMTAGRVLFENGKLVEAAEWFKKVQDRLPTYPKVLFYIAKIDFLSGNIDEAKRKIEQNIKENGETDDDLVFLAEIMVKKDNVIEAENLFKRAQKINGKSYLALVGLADLSTKRNNHDLALDLYKRAIKLRSDDPIVHKKIGDVYRQLGQGALAIESYKMYLEMNPEAPEKTNLENYINLMQ